MHNNTYEVLLNREAYLNLCVQGFYWRSDTWAWSLHMTDLSYSHLGPCRVEADIAWPRAPGEQKQAFTINYTVAINYLRWPKA